MMQTDATKAFFDSNVLLYLLSADVQKANQAELVVRNGGRISVQVLHEIANVARRKLCLTWAETNEFLELIASLCPPEPLSFETHKCGKRIAEHYMLNVYDAMIIASALLAGSNILYSEDMQDGLLIEHQLRICNPFTKPAS